MAAASTQLLEQAVALHGQGDLAQAEHLYRRILEQDPGNFDALHFLGVAQLQSGRPPQGVESISKALAVRPDSVEAWSNLAAALISLNRYADALSSLDKALACEPDFPDLLVNRAIVLQALGRHADALDSCERALSLESDYPEALYNRGNALRALGRHAAALASYEGAIALQADYPEALNNRGIVLGDLDRHEEAIASYERALAIRREYPGALCNRGNTLQALARYEEAVASYDQALTLQPDFTEAHVSRGNALRELKRYEEALAAFDRALSRRLDHADALNGRGVALAALDRHEDALASFDRALALSPRYADACYNRSLVFQRLNRHAEALAGYAETLAIDPGHDDARFNVGYVHLLQGDLAAGWRDYEWRWRKNNHEPLPSFAQPRWTGTGPIEGTRLLIWAEQGFGDTIQFCRYAPLLAKAGAKVVLEVPPALSSLMRSLDGVTVIVRGEAATGCEYHYPLLSLPLAFGTTLDTIPRAAPYLAAAEERVAAWQRVIGTHRELKIGIVCSGNPRHHNDRNRSIPLARFAPLLDTGARLYLLQPECRADDSAFLQTTPRIADQRRLLTDFAETAAAVSCMDLIVSVDTSVAHLAGALGKPVWILLPWAPDWRWLLEREDSPWYPSARLFRQPGSGDWDSVMAQVARALAERLRRT